MRGVKTDGSSILTARRAHSAAGKLARVPARCGLGPPERFAAAAAGLVGLTWCASVWRLETCFDLAGCLLVALATWGFRSVLLGASPGPA